MEREQKLRKQGNKNNLKNMLKAKNPSSLNELSKELGVSKSRLTYYAKIGLIIPVATVGKMQIFERSNVLAVVQKIDKYRRKKNHKKKTLIQIKEEII